ncbi:MULTISPECIES: hypothetical protein [Microbacterium]|uniref:hypothetical protein n=1 Tax=Microbacterium TaxID=33882 RepID=UPI0026E98475|nr:MULTISPECIES: hypothetical protein [Microbacterium]
MSSLAPSTAPDTASAALPGAVVIAAIRRVLLWSLIAAFLYPVFMTASKGICPGGVDGNGGFIDSTGQPVDEAPQCIQLTLAPSPLVYIAIAVIVLLSLGRVMKATGERAALRTLEWTLRGVGLLVVVAIVVSHVWFALIPIEQFTGDSWSVFSPFPFGTIDVEVTPMTTS